MRFSALILALVVLFSSQDSKPITGRTTGRLPYLNYGLGEDRLGGAKMGYLDSNVLVTIVDSVKNDYKVQLSTNHFAYLPKTNFKLDTGTQRQPYYLTSSWRVSGDDKYDYVSIGLTEKLPYRSMQLIDPAAIIVDIFGAVSNTNWITQLKSVKEIKNVWYEQLEDDVFRVHIQLNHKQHWGYYIHYRNNTLQIRVNRQPASLKIRHLKIGIDAGHGGSNSGATGVNSKVNEKVYTLKIAKQLEKYLKCRKAEVFMTRNEDIDVSMIDRTLMLREQQPALMVSIHLNSSGNPTISGVSTYYRYIGFRPLSQKILDRMLQLGLNNFGNVGAFNFSLSGPTEYPNALIEVAFLSNTEDEKKILSDKFQKQVARQIYKGINDWLKNSK
ncbi:MAG: N-acetylmuramoyl-L-alanine amidase [Candidatus Dadabacteria bacterium]